MALRAALGALAVVQAGLGLPWLFGLNPLGGAVDESHLTRDGALGLVAAAAGLLAARQPRTARPLFIVCLAVQVMHLLAGISDRTGNQVGGPFEIVHVLTAAVTLFVGLVAFWPQLRPVAGEPVRHRVVR